LNASGEEAQDRFALAVIVFQLLNFGIHPFTGRPANDRVPTDVPSRIAARLYAYGLKPNPQLSPTPSSGHAAMPADLRQLFDRAFEGTGVARPSPVEWGAALRPYAQRASLKLVKCTSDGEHQHFAGLPCAACARAALISRAKQAAPPASSTIAPATTAVAALLRAAGYPARAPTPTRPAHTGFGRKPFKPILPPSYQNPPTPPPVRYQPPRFQYPPAPSQINVPPRWALVLVLACMFAAVYGFVQSARRVNGLVPAGQGYVPPPSAAAPSPPPPPAVAAVSVDPQAYKGPIAEERRGVDFAGPPSYSDIDLTREAAESVITGAANDDRELVERSMSTLQRQPRTQALPDAAQRRQAANRFAAFVAQAPYPPAARDAGLLGSYAQLQEQPYDAEAACEWSWLALLEGNRGYARTGFLRTIWADPQYACGWLGLSAIADDAASTYGSLVMAETLRFPEEDLVARDRLVEARFQLDSDGLRRWQVIDARARLRVAELRGEQVPAQIARRAEQMLPRRR